MFHSCLLTGIIRGPTNGAKLRTDTRVYSIGYKMKSGVWAFRYDCPANDAAEIRALRRQAIEESARVVEDRPEGGFASLAGVVCMAGVPASQRHP